jgi:aminopeptidase N
MLLKISPDFISKTLIDCEQQLTIRTLQELQEIQLDIAEMKIDKENVSSSVKIDDVIILEKEDKLRICFSELLKQDTDIDISIKYSTGYYYLQDNNTPTINIPRSGFHFISKGEGGPSFQAWTQGQALESRYWFPCIDDPQVKYPREIHIIAPSDGYIVISNGKADEPKREEIRGMNNGKKKIKWIWKEPNPNPAYLTSVVIGKFSEKRVDYDYGRVPLHYYWPADIEENNAMMTFGDTPKMMKFFEEYFGTQIHIKNILK